MNQSAAFAVQATRRFVPDWPPPSPGSLSPPPGKPHPTLIKGKNVAAFTNKEEEEVHTTDVVPFLLETALREHGALYHEAPNWSENVVTDDRLITGQNPASAHGVGVALLNALRRTA